MHCFSLLFTRKNHNSHHDDKIIVRTHERSHDVFEVTYSSPELRLDRQFSASLSSVIHYIEDSLTSMRHDIDPFENIQVTTSIHPSVLYHVSDMDESSVRDLILNMLRDSLRFDVSTIPR